MMKLAWLAMTGISLQVGVSVARYLALRAHRRLGEAARGAQMAASHGVPATRGLPPPIVDRSATALVCQWTAVNTPEDAPGGGRGRLVCHWTHQGSTPGHGQPAVSTAARPRQQGPRSLPVQAARSTLAKDRRRWIS